MEGTALSKKLFKYSSNGSMRHSEIRTTGTALISRRRNLPADVYTLFNIIRIMRTSD